MYRSYSVPMMLGVFTGLILFGINICLYSFNSIVLPAKPITVFSAESVSDNKYSMQFLGKSLVVSIPKTRMSAEINRLSGLCRGAADKKYKYVIKKAVVLKRDVFSEYLSLRIELTRAAGIFLNRGKMFCSEFYWPDR